MSRRKQSKPRAVKLEESDDEQEKGKKDLKENILKRKEKRNYEDHLNGTKLTTVDPEHLIVASCIPLSLKDISMNNNVSRITDTDHQSDDEHSNASLDSDVSVGACSSLWEGGSEEGRGSLSATPTSSEEGRDAISGTPTSASDVEASSTVGVTEATPYLCTFCDLAFPRLSYLKKHEQIHADQLPFRCDFCGRHFKHKRSRDRHVKLHTGDKKYKCNSCEAAFSRSDHLKIHLKTHDSQKPYRCTICTRGYSTAAALTAHMQNHKSSPSVPIDHLLKDVSGCDPSLITRLIQDSTASGLRLKESESLNGQHSKTSPTKTSSPHSDASQQSTSPNPLVKCHICRTHCRNNNHLQSHMSRHHREETRSPSQDRPQMMDCQTSSSLAAMKTEGGLLQDRPPSASNHSGSSSYGVCRPEASPTASSPLSRPTSAITSPRPLNLTTNPFLNLVGGGKLVCPFCSCDGFPSFETFQLHIQSMHGSAMNGDILGLPSTLNSFRGGGLFPPLLSSLGAPGSSRQVTCELCGARVNGIGALQRHVIAAHSFTDLLARVAEGVFCAQCLLPFSNPGALSEHIKLVHSSPSPSLGPTLSLLSGGSLLKRPPSPNRDTPTDLSKKPRRDGGSNRDLPSSTLLCSQCDAPFADFESFRAHLKTHLDGTEGEKAFSCPECHAHVGSEISLESHLANHLEVTSTEYGCPSCLKSFCKPDELQKHLLDMHAHHLYRCALCRQVFDSKVSIQVHFAVKHSNEAKVHKCVKCNVKFRSQTEFDAHLREAHIRHGRELRQNINGITSPQSETHNHVPSFKLNLSTTGSYRCLLCPSTLSSETEMSAHLATHERQFRCSLCDEAFHVEFLLDRHVQAMHVKELNGSQPDSQKSSLSPPNRRHGAADARCGICDIHFSSESSLNLHRKQVHNIKLSSSKIAAATLSLFCAYCSEVCKSRNDLEAHMKAAHVGTGGGRHKCNICDEIYPSPSTLAQHKLSHVKTLSGGISCVVCRETLTSDEQVKVHQNEHHMQTLPQPCVVCRQTLVAEVEIKVHAKFHASQMNSLAVSELENDHSFDSSVNTGIKLPVKCPDCHLKIESIPEVQQHVCHKRNNGNELELKEWKGKMNLTENKELERMARAKRESLNTTENYEGQSGRTYQCIKCQESFDSEAAIESHVASHLEQEGSSHLCHLCRTCFDTPLRLQCHLIEHTFEGCGSFSCYLCASVYTTAARLQQHMVTHGLSSKPYDCHHCRQSFFFRSELENHLPNHNELTNGCRDCQLPSFPTRVRSRTSSSDSTGFPCSACQHVSLSQGEHLAHSLLHKSVHSETSMTPRPCSPPSIGGPNSIGELDPDPAMPECKTCSKKCRNATSLHLHNLTHEGGKPYLCCECGAAFTRRCEASRHCSHQKEKAAKQCSICFKDFGSTSEIAQHLKEDHQSSDSEVVRPESRCSSCDGEMEDHLEASPVVS